MPQSLAKIWVHIIFSTKDRRPFLQEDSIREEMFKFLANEVKEAGCVSASVGGYVDHVHLLVGLSRTVTVAQLVEKIKVESSKWAKKQSQGLWKFSWQKGYGAFSVSHSNRDSVDFYIRNQAEHHATVSYQEEFRRFCEKHGVAIDERYVWD